MHSHERLLVFLVILVWKISGPVWPVYGCSRAAACQFVINIQWCITTPQVQGQRPGFVQALALGGKANAKAKAEGCKAKAKEVGSKAKAKNFGP